MDGIKLDTLENIEKVIPMFEKMCVDEKDGALASMKSIAPLAESIITLTKEVIKLRNEINEIRKK